MFIKSSLSPSITFTPNNSLELLLSSINFCGRILYIGTSYHPPRPILIIIALLSTTLSNLPSSLLSNLTLVGDYNVNYSPSSRSPLLSSLQAIADSYPLHQIITNPTHFSYTGTISTIDLVFTSSASYSKDHILIPVSNCPHSSILFNFSPHSNSSFLPFPPQILLTA